MKPPLLALIVLLAPSTVFAQNDNNNQSWTGGIGADGWKFKSADNSNSSTKLQAESDASGQLAQAADLDAKDKQEILQKLSALMTKAESDHQLHQTSYALELKTALFFGKTVLVHLCAAPEDQLPFESDPKRLRCHGNALEVSWTDSQTSAQTWEKQGQETKDVAAAPAHDLFDPNSFEVDPKSKDGAALEAEIEQVAEAARAGGALKSVSVRSSASTLRDTGAAASMSHSNLSRARAEKAFAYVAKRLADWGVPVDSDWSYQRDDAEGNDSVSLDYGGGDSCNGTTGPNPPSNYVWTSDLNNNTPGGPPAQLTPDGRAAVRDQYNQYQFVDVSFEVLEPAQQPQEKTKTTASETPYKAFVTIEKPPRPGGGGWTPPPFHPFGFVKKLFGPGKRNWGSTACPKRF